jgi:hypothetical protein
MIPLFEAIIFLLLLTAFFSSNNFLDNSGLNIIHSSMHLIFEIFVNAWYTVIAGYSTPYYYQS